MIGQLRLHAGSHAKRFVNSAKVIVSEMQAESVPVVFKLLREAVSKPRHAANLHTNGEVLALYNRRADACRIRIAADLDNPY